MTTLLEAAFAVAERLPPSHQDELAARLLVDVLATEADEEARVREVIDELTAPNAQTPLPK